MSSEAAIGAARLPEAGTERTGWRRILPASENLLVSLALAAMIAVPLAEVVLRRTLRIGIKGSTSIVQHLCLVVGMLGGAIAARENRLLALSTLGGLLKGRLKSVASGFGGAIAAAVTTLLGVASVQFVLTERQAQSILAYGVPVWWVQTILPVGFALVTVYLLGHAATTWPGRVATGVLAAAAVLPTAFPSGGSRRSCRWVLRW